jgi:hypothetical protein
MGSQVPGLKYLVRQYGRTDDRAMTMFKKQNTKNDATGHAFAPPSRSDLAVTLPVALIVAGFGVGTLLARQRGYGISGETVVHCSQHHLFTTIWTPSASLKALRLSPTRFQRCPVGHHWSLVAPVHAQDLTEEQQQAAAAFHDTRVS